MQQKNITQKHCPWTLHIHAVQKPMIEQSVKCKRLITVRQSESTSTSPPKPTLIVKKRGNGTRKTETKLEWQNNRSHYNEESGMIKVKRSPGLHVGSGQGRPMAGRKMNGNNVCVNEVQIGGLLCKAKLLLKYQWLNLRLWYLWCVSTGDTTVLH